MKKLLTFLFLQTCFIGAKGVEIVDAEIDFSQYTDISQVNFSSWEASESAIARLSIRNGCLHFQSEVATDPSWDCQFVPIGGVEAEVGVIYTLHFKVKGDHAGNVSMLGFGQKPYGVFSITTDWREGSVNYVCTNSSEGYITMECGDWVGTWDIAYLKITHEVSPLPATWQEWLTNNGKSIIPGIAAESVYMGNAEFGQWPDWSLQETDGINANWRGDRTGEICAWALTMGRNYDDKCAEFSQESFRARPYPADIEKEAGNESNHVFAVHVNIVRPIDTNYESIAWSNQFWIQSPHGWKTGTMLKIKFRYKADRACSASTNWNQKNPTKYLHWQAIGDVNFTTEWQEFDKTVTLSDEANGAWSLGFNLCYDETNGRKPNVFYFDDLSWETIVLDEGLFVATSNTITGTDYNFDNAIEFHAEDDLMVATVGEVGKQDTWVNEIMISTVRGYDGTFISSTIKPSGNYIGEDCWGDYTDGSNAKIKLPTAGVWKISLDREGKQINIIKVEGDNPTKPKCATPEISYSNGKITFSCETEGVEYVSEIKCEDCKKHDSGEITLTQKYKVSVYATKVDYNKSDVATREIVIENGQTSLLGDINKDGKVNVTDAVKLIDIIMNK